MKLSPTRPVSRGLALAAVLCLALGSCGGDDDSGSFPSNAGEDGAGAKEDKPSKSRPSENACPPETAALLPAGFDPESCWTVASASDPVIVGETVFALVGEVPGEVPPTLVAFDAASGDEVWTSDPLPGEVTEIAAVEVDGEPGVAVLVVEDDPGDAVTEASQAWGYLAWPADVEKSSPTDPSVHITAPAANTSFGEVRWTDQGVLADDQLLQPDAAAFEQVEIEPEPIMVGYYDLDESFVGVSGDALLSYVSGLAWEDGGPEDGSSYFGWLARAADGTQTWDGVTSSPNEEDTTILFAGPARLAFVVGDYALAIIPTDDTYSAYELSWVDASTGAAADPAPDDLAGAIPVGVSTDPVTDAVDTMLSPDGKYLFLSWSTLSLVVDIGAGTVTAVDSDFEITGHAIDDTTAFASTQAGGVMVDLATATATALDAPQESPDAVTDDYGAIVTEGEELGAENLVVARRGR